MIAVRVRGLRVRVGLGSPAVLAVVGAGLAASTEPAVRVATVAALLVVPPLHEAARVWALRRHGVRVLGLRLAVFGGAPAIRDATSSPRAEALAGLAGLATAAGVAAALTLPTVGGGAPALVPIARWSVALAVVQAMPALPLDGGRVLRAWAWYLADDPVAGTRTAAIAAQIIAAGLVATGVGLFLLESDGTIAYWALWAAVAGWQIAALARAEARHARRQHASEALTLGDAAAASGRPIRAETNLADAVDSLLEDGTTAALLVVDAGDRPVGVLRPSDLRRVRRADWDRCTVAEAMTPLANLPRLPWDLSLSAAADLLEERGWSVVVVERDGRPVAPLTAARLAGPLPERPGDEDGRLKQGAGDEGRLGG